MLADKQIVRQHIKALKEALSDRELMERSAIIWSKIELLPQFKDARVLMLYWSFNKEVYTHDFIKKWARHKKIVLPVIIGDNIILKLFTGVEHMQKDMRFGIYEPLGIEFKQYDSIDLIIAPGIAFDANNYRIGRGKGYYDKFLSNNETYKIGVGFNFQQVPKLPIEEHDIPMDLVISE